MKSPLIRTLIAVSTIAGIYLIVSSGCKFIDDPKGKCWSILKTESSFIDFNMANYGVGFICLLIVLFGVGFLIQRNSA